MRGREGVGGFGGVEEGMRKGKEEEGGTWAGRFLFFFDLMREMSKIRCEIEKPRLLVKTRAFAVRSFPTSSSLVLSHSRAFG